MGGTLNEFLNLPWYIDLTIASIWIVMALVHGQLIARLGHSLVRWMRLIGWSGLGVWWMYRLSESGDLRVSAPSVFFVLVIAAASMIGARQQLRLARADVRCFQDPSHRCFREDRVREALLGE